jgi:hypothetical protein
MGTFVFSNMCLLLQKELYSVCSNTDVLCPVTGQMSVTQSFTWGDEISLLDPDPELPDLKLPSLEKWIGETSADKLTVATSLEKPALEKTGIDKSNLYGNETQSPVMDATDADNDSCDDGSSIVEESQSDYSSIRIGNIQGKNIQKKINVTSLEMVKVGQLR